MARRSRASATRFLSPLILTTTLVSALPQPRHPHYRQQRSEHQALRNVHPRSSETDVPVVLNSGPEPDNFFAALQSVFEKYGVDLNDAWGRMAGNAASEVGDTTPEGEEVVPVQPPAAARVQVSSTTVIITETPTPTPTSTSTSTTETSLGDAEPTISGVPDPFIDPPNSSPVPIAGPTEPAASSVDPYAAASSPVVGGQIGTPGPALLWPLPNVGPPLEDGEVDTDPPEDLDEFVDDGGNPFEPTSPENIVPIFDPSVFEDGELDEFNGENGNPFEPTSPENIVPILDPSVFEDIIEESDETSTISPISEATPVADSPPFPNATDEFNGMALEDETPSSTTEPILSVTPTPSIEPGPEATATTSEEQFNILPFPFPLPADPIPPTTVTAAPDLIDLSGATVEFTLPPGTGMPEIRIVPFRFEQPDPTSTPDTSATTSTDPSIIQDRLQTPIDEPSDIVPIPLFTPSPSSTDTTITTTSTTYITRFVRPVPVTSTPLPPSLPTPIIDPAEIAPILPPPFATGADLAPALPLSAFGPGFPVSIPSELSSAVSVPVPTATGFLTVISSALSETISTSVSSGVEAPTVVPSPAGETVPPPVSGGFEWPTVIPSPASETITVPKSSDIALPTVTPSPASETFPLPLPSASTQPVPAPLPPPESNFTIVPPTTNLSEICANPEIETISLPLISEFYGPNAYPSLNLFPGCLPPPANSSWALRAPGLLNCTQLGREIQACQQSGTRVLLQLSADDLEAVGGNQFYGDPAQPSEPFGPAFSDANAPGAEGQEGQEEQGQTTTEIALGGRISARVPNLFDAYHPPSPFALTLFSLFSEGRTERADLRPLGGENSTLDGVNWFVHPLGEQVVVDGFDIRVPRAWEGTYQDAEFGVLVERLLELTEEAWEEMGGVEGSWADLGRDGKGVVVRSWV